jgi:hypothetical protein
MHSSVFTPLQTAHALAESCRFGPILDQTVKDPCPVFDGHVWHLFATGWSHERDGHEIVHAIATDVRGPWTTVAPSQIVGTGSHQMAAPGVVWSAEDNCFHMFIQTLFNEFGGYIEHLTSPDGHTFTKSDTALTSNAAVAEDGIYDPHPAEIHGQKYITYSAFRTIGQPEIYLARSVTNMWNGPWERCGRILRHDELWHHNQPHHPDFEWGLEGSQLIALPNGQVLLNAVCFLPEGTPGTRQRVFFALADSPRGPFVSLGPILAPGSEQWESGENGHASGCVHDGRLHLFYQARSQHAPWRFGHAEFTL